MLDLLDYILPYRCVNCQRILSQKETPLCVSCHNSLSFTHEALNMESDTATLFQHHSQVIAAASLLNFSYGNVAQKLIHANKYHNQPQIGAFLAELAKPILNNITVDVVTCVPSHASTKRTRGYNQVALFAQTIAQILETAYHPHLIQRIHRKDSQTHRSKKERIASLSDVFVASEECSQYSSIMLIDDVMTTGSTLNVCVEALEKKTNASITLLAIAKVI